MSRQGGRGAAADFDFVNHIYSVAGTAITLANVLKENTNFVGGLYGNPSGLLIAVGANAPQVSNYGLECWPDRSNGCLWCRDLTNAAWTAGVTMTVAKNQTGADGAATSASSITGGAVKATNTVLQAITIASRQLIFSAMVKRLVGTGTLEMTMDNGTSWIDVTTLVPASGYSAMLQVYIPTQTLANPTVGFRIGTNADSFAIDYCQLEWGNTGVGPTVNSPSPPIATTTVAVNRPHNRLSTNSAVVQTVNPLILGAYGFYWEGNTVVPPTGGASFGFVSDGFANMGLAIDGHASFTAKSAPAGQLNYGTPGQHIKNKVAGFIKGDGSGALAVNGNAATAFTGASLSPAATHFDLGSNGTGGNSADMQGQITRFTLFADGFLASGDLVRITT